MVAVALIGAGSTVFARGLVCDLLAFADLRDELDLRLHDIDERRLATSEIVALRLVQARGATTRVRATTDLEAALEGADYVVTMFQVVRAGHSHRLRPARELRAAADDRRHGRHRRHHAGPADRPGPSEGG